MTEVPQTKYNFYGQPGSTDEYWNHINSIAMFIAGSLSDSSNTIYVSSHKEKFGDVRIYCVLAQKQLIRERYSVTDETFSKTRKSCLDFDANVYRSRHLSMVSLVPQYEKAIVQNADYTELLNHKSKFDFDNFFMTRVVSNINFYLHRYEFETPQDLYDFFIRVCEYKK